METKDYGGWTNYETWLFNLWLDNEEYTNKLVRDLARTSKDIYTFSRELEDMADQMATEALGEQNNGFIVDLVNAGLKEINYNEIAKYLIEEVEANQ